MEQLSFFDAWYDVLNNLNKAMIDMRFHDAEESLQVLAQEQVQDDSERLCKAVRLASKAWKNRLPTETPCSPEEISALMKAWRTYESEMVLRDYTSLSFWKGQRNTFYRHIIGLERSERARITALRRCKEHPLLMWIELKAWDRACQSIGGFSHERDPLIPLYHQICAGAIFHAGHIPESRLFLLEACIALEPEIDLETIPDATLIDAIEDFRWLVDTGNSMKAFLSYVLYWHVQGPTVIPVTKSGSVRQRLETICGTIESAFRENESELLRFHLFALLSILSDLAKKSAHSYVDFRRRMKELCPEFYELHMEHVEYLMKV